MKVWLLSILAILLLFVTSCNPVIEVNIVSPKNGEYLPVDPGERGEVKIVIMVRNSSKYLYKITIFNDKNREIEDMTGYSDGYMLEKTVNLPRGNYKLHVWVVSPDSEDDTEISFHVNERPKLEDLKVEGGGYVLNNGYGEIRYIKNMNLTFSWRSSDDDGEIALSRTFTLETPEGLKTESLSSDSFTLRKVKPGTYRWKIRLEDPHGFYTDSGFLEVYLENSDPSVSIDLPGGGVGVSPDEDYCFYINVEDENKDDLILRYSVIVDGKVVKSESESVVLYPYTSKRIQACVEKDDLEPGKRYTINANVTDEWGRNDSTTAFFETSR